MGDRCAIARRAGQKETPLAGRRAGDAIAGGVMRHHNRTKRFRQVTQRTPILERVIAYIDGFNLYFGLKSKGWRRYYWLDLRSLVLNLLKPTQRLVELKYFTARISSSTRHAEKQKRQNTYLEAVETMQDTRIYYGHYLQKSQTCFRCGATWDSHEEKMTDVNIAVEMLNDASDDLLNTALLISADSDLTAPVEAIRNRFPDKRVVLACPPNRQSKRLESSANGCFRIGRKKIQDSQFPDEVHKPDGFVLLRPSTWR